MRCSFSLGIIGLTLAAAACAAHEDLGDRSDTTTGADGSKTPSADPDASTPTTSPTTTADASPPPAASGKLVLFGGIDETGLLGDTWTWDGAAWTENKVTGPSARAWASGASLAGNAVLFGGGDATGNVADTWSWDGAAWTQQKVTGPSARSRSSAATLGGTIVLFGGDDLDDTDTWTWNGTAWSSNASADGPEVGDGWAATTFNGAVLLEGAGGYYSYGGSSWAEHATASGGPSASGGQSVATLGANVVWFGGDGENFNSLAETWTWDGTNWTLRNVAGPGPRSYAAMATLGSTVVLFGGCTFGFQGTDGSSGRHCTNDTWTWDGTTWTQHNVPGPSARAAAFFTAE